MHIAFRNAQPGDFDYCASLYFAWAGKVIEELNLSMPVQVSSFRQGWAVEQVQIITRDGADVGWMQSRLEGDALHLVQLFVDAPFRGQGIGRQVMQCLFKEAAGRPMTLGVVKTNPARRLYERMGFRPTHEDERKIYMRRDPLGEAQFFD